MPGICPGLHSYCMRHGINALPMVWCHALPVVSYHYPWCDRMQYHWCDRMHRINGVMDCIARMWHGPGICLAYAWHVFFSLMRWCQAYARHMPVF